MYFSVQTRRCNNRKRNDQNKAIADIIGIMRRGAILHLCHQQKGACWSLSTGQLVPTKIAQLVAINPLIVADADALFGAPSQTYRYRQHPPSTPADFEGVDPNCNPNPNRKAPDMPTLNELFPAKYLSAADLKGKAQIAVIDRVGTETFENDGAKQAKPIVFFRNGIKPLILNKTNAGTIAEIAGSDNTDDWKGKRVSLYATMVPFKGKLTAAVRVKAVPSKTLPEELNDKIDF